MEEVKKVLPPKPLSATQTALEMVDRVQRPSVFGVAPPLGLTLRRAPEELGALAQPPRLAGRQRLPPLVKAQRGQRLRKWGETPPRDRWSSIRQSSNNQQVGEGDSADGPDSDLVISNSLFWNWQSACRVAVVPLNPKVLGSIPGAGINNASRQTRPDR